MKNNPPSASGRILLLGLLLGSQCTEAALPKQVQIYSVPPSLVASRVLVTNIPAADRVGAPEDDEIEISVSNFVDGVLQTEMIWHNPLLTNGSFELWSHMHGKWYSICEAYKAFAAAIYTRLLYHSAFSQDPMNLVYDIAADKLRVNFGQMGKNVLLNLFVFTEKQDSFRTAPNQFPVMFYHEGGAVNNAMLTEKFPGGSEPRHIIVPLWSSSIADDEGDLMLVNGRRTAKRNFTFYIEEAPAIDKPLAFDRWDPVYRLTPNNDGIGGLLAGDTLDDRLINPYFVPGPRAGAIGKLGREPGTGEKLSNAVGMLEFGAVFLARNGLSWDQILRHYYHVMPPIVSEVTLYGKDVIRPSGDEISAELALLANLSKIYRQTWSFDDRTGQWLQVESGDGPSPGRFILADKQIADDDFMTVVVSFSEQMSMTTSLTDLRNVKVRLVPATRKQSVRDAFASLRPVDHALAGSGTKVEGYLISGWRIPGRRTVWVGKFKKEDILDALAGEPPMVCRVEVSDAYSHGTRIQLAGC